MAKYSRVQFVFTCKTCDEKITFSIYYGLNQIWNNKDAGKFAEWHNHEDHDTELTYQFFIGDEDEREYES